MGEDDLPEWMTHGPTVLCQKDPQIVNTADNYRPITCLPLMWKLSTGVKAEEMYNYLEREKILPDNDNNNNKFTGKKFLREFNQKFSRINVLL